MGEKAMNKARQLALAGAAIASLAWAAPAMAVTSTRVVITQDQQEVPETRIQLFDADTGTEVRREDDDDGSGALYLLDGDVTVDGAAIDTSGYVPRLAGASAAAPKTKTRDS